MRQRLAYPVGIGVLDGLEDGQRGLGAVDCSTVLAQMDGRYWTIRFGPLTIGPSDDHTNSVQRTSINVLPMCPV